MLVQLTGPLPWAIEIFKRQAPCLSGKMKLGCTVVLGALGVIDSSRFLASGFVLVSIVSSVKLPCCINHPNTFMFKKSVLYQRDVGLDWKSEQSSSQVYLARHVFTQCCTESPGHKRAPHEQCGCPHPGGPHCLLQPSPDLNSATENLKKEAGNPRRKMGSLKQKKQPNA